MSYYVAITVRTAKSSPSMRCRAIVEAYYSLCVLNDDLGFQLILGRRSQRHELDQILGEDQIQGPIQRYP